MLRIIVINITMNETGYLRGFFALLKWEKGFIGHVWDGELALRFILT